MFFHNPTCGDATMTAAQGTVRYHHKDNTVTFRVEGRGTMTQSLPMRRCAERLIAGGTTRVHIDLRDCSYMDSTFLGTILSLKKTLDRSPMKSLALVMPSPACSRILQQMGLLDVLPPHAVEVDSQAQWSDLGPEDDLNSMRSNVTQAHEELAQLPGKAGEQFKAVIRCLAESAKTDKPSE
jgi:anti-anti-sigma factor